MKGGAIESMCVCHGEFLMFTMQEPGECVFHHVKVRSRKMLCLCVYHSRLQRNKSVENFGWVVAEASEKKMAKNWYKLYVIMSWAHKNTFSWHMFLPPTRTFFVLLSKLFCRLMLKNLTHITSNVCRLWMTKSSSRSHRQQTSISIKCWNNAIELYRQSPFISLTHEK